MCTAVMFQAGCGYFGRNLDLEYAFGEQIAVMPRGFALAFRKAPPLVQHYAMIGTAYVPDRFPLFYDATNEKGLSMAALNFPHYAVYAPPDAPCMGVAPFEMIPFVLAQCATLAEAAELLRRVTVKRIDYSDRLPCTPLHWLLADKTGAVAVEPCADGLRLCDDPIGVLTNSPPLPYHLTRLADFTSLSPDTPSDCFGDAQTPLYSRGMGTMGLPGDFSSVSRFVKAAFVKLHAVCEAEECSAVSQMFHILDSVSHPRGCVRMPDGRYEITVYSSCCNVDTGVYYYKTYDNSDIQAVAMHDAPLDDSALRQYAFQTVPSVFRCP